MANIAVYDKFYQSKEYPLSDIAGQALVGSEHSIIGAATDLREAARQILNFAGMEVAKRPNVIIMGGMLDGEPSYRENPLTITEPITVRRRTWMRNVKEESGQRVTYLLPQFEEDGKAYNFPSIVAVGDVPNDPPRELYSQWNVRRTGIAACVLSRIVETYLPETVRLGVSSYPMFDATLSAAGVQRDNQDAVQQLQAHVQRFLDTQ